MHWQVPKIGTVHRDLLAAFWEEFQANSMFGNSDTIVLHMMSIDTYIIGPL